MSAFGYKRTLGHTVIYVRFTPESRHNRRVREMSANDPKRTFIELRGSKGGCSEKKCLPFFNRGLEGKPSAIGHCPVQGSFRGRGGAATCWCQVTCDRSFQLVLQKRRYDLFPFFIERC